MMPPSGSQTSQIWFHFGVIELAVYEHIHVEMSLHYPLLNYLPNGTNPDSIPDMHSCAYSEYS
jgi:hypothetical protein